jgi:hypothetical protein
MSNMDLKVLSYLCFIWLTTNLLLIVKKSRKGEEFQMLIWTKL